MHSLLSISTINSKSNKKNKTKIHTNFSLIIICKARRSIIEIHTKEWNPRLSKNFISELADQCVGYCGADIKALCTEAALIALRRRYPQIYGTNKKLVLDTDKIKITIKDFQYAMKQVVPASQRSVVSPGRALHRVMRPLLESTLELVLERIRQFFPPANTICGMFYA